MSTDRTIKAVDDLNGMTFGTTAHIGEVVSGAQTPTWVRGNYAQGTNTANFTSNTAGDLLVAGVWAAAGGTLSVSDSAGNTYTSIGSATDANGSKSQLFYVANCTASGSTNTVTVSGNVGFTRLALGEWSGVAATSPLRTHSEANGNSTTPDTGNMTVTVGDLVVGWLEDEDGGNASFTIDATYTYREGQGNGASFEALCDKLAASTTEHPNGTGHADKWTALGAAFKPGP